MPPDALLPGDLLALRRLMHLYGHRIDNGTPEAIAALFLPDGVLHLGFMGRRADQTGRPAVQAWFADYMTKTRAESAHNRHRIGSVAFTPAGPGQATGQAWWDASGIRRATGDLHLLRGHYRDTFVRAEGRWYFARREIHLAVQVAVPAAPPPGVCRSAWTALPPSSVSPVMDP